MRRRFIAQADDRHYELVVLQRQATQLADDLYRLNETEAAVLTEAYRTTVIDKLIERNMR